MTFECHSRLPEIAQFDRAHKTPNCRSINGDGGCRLRQPVQADSQPKLSGLVLSRRPLGAVLHSSNEPGELSQWLCHDDGTINIVLDIITIIIIIMPYLIYIISFPTYIQISIENHEIHISHLPHL